MTYTQTEIVGFGKNVLEIVDEVEAALEETALDADEMRRILSEKLQAAADANARQEAAKIASKEATEDVVAALDALYRMSSGYLDAMMGAIGKGSPAAQTMRRLRSRIRRPGTRTGGAIAVEPLPEAEA